MKTEQFECGYAIYQVSDGTFRVWRLDENGKRVSMVKNGGDDFLDANAWEFYANALCGLMKDLLTNQGEDT